MCSERKDHPQTLTTTLTRPVVAYSVFLPNRPRGALSPTALPGPLEWSPSHHPFSRPRLAPLHTCPRASCQIGLRKKESPSSHPKTCGERYPGDAHPSRRPFTSFPAGIHGSSRRPEARSWAFWGGGSAGQFLRRLPTVHSARTTWSEHATPSPQEGAVARSFPLRMLSLKS